MKKKLNGKIFIAVWLLAILAVSFPVGLAKAADSDTQVAIQILTVNDFHGALFEQGKNPGAAKLGRFLRTAKEENPDNTIILSAGDMFQGSPDSNMLYGQPVVDFMNQLGFDAMTLGNHEFDWGIATLKKLVNHSHFPYVCANVLVKNTGQPLPFVKPYVILNRGGLKIAVIGIATPQTAYKTNPAVVSGLLFTDPGRTVGELIPQLKKPAEVDLIIVLSHLTSFMDKEGTVSGEAAALANQVPALNGIVSGHSHQTVAGTVNGIPVVQANYNGRAVGKIDIIYDKNRRTVEKTTVQVISLPYDGLQPDNDIESLLSGVRKKLAPVKNTVLGNTIRPLNHNRDERAVSVLGQWVTDKMREAVKADIAFQNAGGLRAGIPAGAITLGVMYEIMPFDDDLVTVEMTGAQIGKVLATGIEKAKSGMVQYSGLRVGYDETKPPEQRLVSVTTLDGAPLDPDKNYKVAVNDFLLAGGDQFTIFKEGKNSTDTNIPVRDILIQAIKKTNGIDFSGDDRFYKTGPATVELKPAA